MAIILCKRQERNEGKRRAHEKREGTKKGGAPKGAPPEKSGGSVTGWLKRRPVKREEPSKAAGPSIFSLKCFALHRTRGKTRLSAHFGPVGAVPFASRFTFFKDKIISMPADKPKGRVLRTMVFQYSHLCRIPQATVSERLPEETNRCYALSVELGEGLPFPVKRDACPLASRQ